MAATGHIFRREDRFYDRLGKFRSDDLHAESRGVEYEIGDGVWKKRCGRYCKAAIFCKG